MGKRRNLLSEDELRIVQKPHTFGSDELAFKLFFEDCQLRNLRPHTLKYYREQFNAIKRTLVTLTEKDIKFLILNMQESRLKVTTINSRSRAIRSFFNFLHRSKHIKKNPMANIKLLKERKQAVNSLSKEQLQLLFSLCDKRTFTKIKSPLCGMMLDSKLFFIVVHP
ncbi:site-specific integrase [Peribacillus butanolivorans]|uniref:site-specific integrase n=1 Tax=Peribacillus butanolivorans TaxID=421767 RepID=UPI0036DCAA94